MVGQDQYTTLGLILGQGDRCLRQNGTESLLVIETATVHKSDKFAKSEPETGTGSVPKD